VSRLVPKLARTSLWLANHEVGEEAYANSEWQVQLAIWPEKGEKREREKERVLVVTNYILFFSQVDVANVFRCGHARESTWNERRDFSLLFHPFLISLSLSLSLSRVVR